MTTHMEPMAVAAGMWYTSCPRGTEWHTPCMCLVYRELTKRARSMHPRTLPPPSPLSYCVLIP